MEINGKWFCVRIKFNELIDLLSKAEYESLERKILAKAKEKTGEPLATIDRLDDEGYLEFGVAT